MFISSTVMWATTALWRLEADDGRDDDAAEALPLKFLWLFELVSYNLFDNALSVARIRSIGIAAIKSIIN